MDSKTPAIVFLILGILTIVFRGKAVLLVQWLDKKTWTEERRKQFPGHGGQSKDCKPWHFIILGASWIGCAIIFWFTSK